MTFRFDPACAYSQITSDYEYTTQFRLTIGGSADFEVNTSSYSHEYASLWNSRGIAESCTISYRLEGEAAEFSSISGSTVTISPTDRTKFGDTKLYIVAYYSASAWETSVLSDAKNLRKEVQIIVQRGYGIETWSTHLIAIFSATLVTQIIVVSFLCLNDQRLDRQKKQKIPEIRDPRVNLIKLD